MKLYTAKTLEECLATASEELETPVEDIIYTVVEEKKGIFSKKVTISVEEISDVIEFTENYIKDVCHALGLDASLKTFYRDNIIKVLIETNRNAVLIGNNGVSLQSLNELTKLAVSTKFKRKFKILLDIGNYKEKKYRSVIFVAKKAAKVMVGFSDAKSRLKSKDNVVYTGTPAKFSRETISNLDKEKCKTNDTR